MDDRLSQHIGRRLRARRRLLDLSQAALGQRCGLSFQTVHKYETGTVRISAAGLYDLAEALQVCCSYFFEGFRRDAPPPRAEDGRAALRGRPENRAD